MSTAHQRLYVGSQKKKDNKRTQYLRQCPQARGWVNRTTIVTPRKPNSAKRPVVKVFIRKGGRLTAYIPGIGHTLKKFSKILVRGRGPRDLPAVRYSCVRGVQDFIGLEKKKRRRSIYGAPQNDPTKIKPIAKYRWAIRRAERDRVKKENIESRIKASANFARDISNYYITKSYDLRYRKILRKFQFFRRKVSETPFYPQLFLILIYYLFIYYNEKCNVFVAKNKFTKSSLEFYLYLDCGVYLEGLDLTRNTKYVKSLKIKSLKTKLVNIVNNKITQHKNFKSFFLAKKNDSIKLQLELSNYYFYRYVNNLFYFNYLIFAFNLRKFTDIGVFKIFCKYSYKLSTTLLSTTLISISSYVIVRSTNLFNGTHLKTYLDYSCNLPNFFKFFFFKGLNAKNRHYYYYHYKRPRPVIPYYIEKKLVKLEHHHQALFYKKTDLLKLCEPILNDNPILREALYLKNNLVKQNLVNNHSLKKKIKYYKFNRNNLQVFNLVVDLLYGTKNNKYSLDENFFSINNLNSFFFEKYKCRRSFNACGPNKDELFFIKRFNVKYDSSIALKKKKYAYLSYSKFKELNSYTRYRYKIRFFNNFNKTHTKKLKLI